MTQIPQAAIADALPLAERLALQYGLPEEIDHEEVHAFTIAMLEAAAPHIAAAERQRIRQLEAALEIATTTLHRLALIDEIAGMGQRDHDPELKARCRKAQLALDGIADLLDDPAEPTDADGVSLIAAERKRQIAKEGWTAEHDAAHNNGVLARAGACYAWYAATGYQLAPLDIWPWRVESWKPGDHPVRTLAKAGALIAAEIDRLTGPQPASAGPEPGEHATTHTNEPTEHEL